MCHKLRVSALLLAVLVTDLVVQVRPASSLTTAQYASPRVNVLIDETHVLFPGGHFYPNTVYMRSVLSRQGYSFDRTSAINSTILAPYDVLVTDLYGENHTGSEVRAIKNWVSDGGRLVLIGEGLFIRMPWQNNVSAAFEVWFKSGFIYDDVHNFNQTSYWIEVANFTRHPLTRNIGNIVLGAAGIIDMDLSRGVAVVAWSSADSYVNASWVGRKKSGPWPVIGCKPYGGGRVSMISDISLWTEPRLINSTSWQTQLFRNMAEPWSYEVVPKIVDSRGNPLEGAGVETRSPNATILSAKTNSTGHVALRGLGNGSYAITVFWQGVPVNQTTVTVGILEGDASPELKTRVYYLTVVVTSGIFGGRVPGAQVVVYFPNRTQLASGTTDASGSMEFGQVPTGSWSVEVRAQYASTSATVSLDSDQPLEVRITLTSEVLVVTLPMVAVIVGVWAYILLRWKRPPRALEHEKSKI